MISKDKQDVIEAIAYSRLESQSLSAGECIILHQWHNGHSEPNAVIKAKYHAIRKQIKDAKWQKPRLQYVDGGELYAGWPGTKSYRKIN